MVRARPPRPRCNAAACWNGVILPAETRWSRHVPLEQIRGKALDRPGPNGGRLLLRRLPRACVPQRAR
eukprot:8994565-Pyramimonas_sp.AAC.1